MDVSVAAFLALLGLVGALRLAELRLSRRNQREMAARGARKIAEPHFRWMVLTHAGVLASAALEVVFLRRVFLLANAVRWWVMRTLKGRWNVQVMDAAGLGIVTSGPFRAVRHPNYAAVFAEMLTLPLIHTAWLTALAGGAAHAWALSRRIALEERVLLADPAYRESMGRKPRFLPGLF